MRVVPRLRYEEEEEEGEGWKRERRKENVLIVRTTSAISIATGIGRERIKKVERIDWLREDYHRGLFKLIVRVFRADKFPSVYIIVAVEGSQKETPSAWRRGETCRKSGKSGNLNSP